MATAFWWSIAARQSNLMPSRVRGTPPASSIAPNAVGLLVVHEQPVLYDVVIGQEVDTRGSYWVHSALTGTWFVVTPPGPKSAVERIREWVFNSVAPPPPIESGYYMSEPASRSLQGTVVLRWNPPVSGADLAPSCRR